LGLRGAALFVFAAPFHPGDAMPRDPYDRRPPGGSWAAISSKIDTLLEAVFGVPFTVGAIVGWLRASTWREIFDPASWGNVYFYVGMAMVLVLSIWGPVMIWKTLQRLGFIGRRE
jgi:hypothetical protein